jgi:two-component system sensor histidine kinase DegS
LAPVLDEYDGTVESLDLPFSRLATPVVSGSKSGLDAPTPYDELEGLAAEARRELTSAEARVCALLDRTQALNAAITKDRAYLQNIIDEFSLDLSVAASSSMHSSQGTGPLFDLGKVRESVDELDGSAVRAAGLNGNLTAIAAALRTFIEQLSPEQAFRPAQETPDVRFQQAMNAVREEERRRLAREIHDGPAQVVNNAAMYVHTVEQIAKRAPDQVADELAQLREYLKDGVAEIRRFMFDLRPTMLQDLGLVPTLERYVESFSRFFGRAIALHVARPLPTLTTDQELTVFRVLQESLQNFHKHGGADAEAWIDLVTAGNVLVLTVRDNGRGFDPSAVVPRLGHGGLIGMKERADAIGAELTIESTPGEGTLVTLKMPLRGHTGLLRSVAA